MHERQKIRFKHYLRELLSPQNEIYDFLSRSNDSTGDIKGWVGGVCRNWVMYYDGSFLPHKEHQREPGMEMPPCCKSWDCGSREIENMVPTAHTDLVTKTPLLQMGSKSNLTGVVWRGEKELESSFKKKKKKTGLGLKPNTIIRIWIFNSFNSSRDQGSKVIYKWLIFGN